MGIKNLSSLIQLYAPNSITKLQFSDLTGKKIALDASLLIYAYVIAIRNSSDDLKNIHGEITSHIHAVVSKTLLYLDNGITPIFVFDGKPPSLKNDTLSKRREDREVAKKLLEDESDDEKKIKLFKKSTVITWKQMDQCKEILRAMGIPVIDSPEESDSQCAILTNNNVAYGVGSEDMDILTFGAKKLLRNISSSKRNEIIEYDLVKILEELKYTHQEFIDLCILLGCDYVDHIDGVGVKRAKDIIDEYRTIDNFIEKSPDVKSGKFKIDEDYLKEVNQARYYFLNGPGNIYLPNEVKLVNLDQKKIKELLINKYSYSKTKVEKIIKKIIDA
jgi:flap endonuclease-1